MSKLKTHRGAAKRFKKTGSGGYKMKHSHLRHILTKKASKRKLKLRAKGMVAEADQAAIDQMLPNL